MREGQKTLAAIETSIADLQARERTLQAGLEEVNAKRTGLVDKRLKAIRELATVRTRNALADGVIDASDRLSDQVASLLAARTETVSALEERYRSANETRQEWLGRHAERATELDSLEARLDAAGDAVRQDAEAHPDYAAALKRRDEAAATLERARAKAKQAHENRDEKGRPYENDPLFMYLWKRKYGRDGYEANSLIRLLDGWVADLVRYHDARANYSVLRQIPDRLDAHAARLAEIVKLAQADVDRHEAVLIEAAAGADLIGTLQAARQSYAEENVELARMADQISEITSQLNRYAEGQDHAFRQAVDITAGFLAEERLSRLQRVARSTPTPSDDQIVERIEKIDDDTARLREKAQDDREELERLFKKKSELLKIAAEFRRRHYDDPGSVFIPQGTGEVLLRELLRGAIDAAEYWARTRSSHKWRSRPGDSYRRRSRSWPLGDMDFDFDIGDWDDDDFFTDDSF